MAMTSILELFKLRHHIFQFPLLWLSDFVIVLCTNIIIKVWPKQIDLLTDRLFHSIYNCDSFVHLWKVRERRKEEINNYVCFYPFHFYPFQTHIKGFLVLLWNGSATLEKLSIPSAPVTRSLYSVTSLNNSTIEKYVVDKSKFYVACHFIIKMIFDDNILPIKWQQNTWSCYLYH